MPDTASITTLKSFTYRGAKEEYSNTYHFTGTTPANDAAWLALYQAIRDAEKPCLTSAVEWNGALGYEPGNDHAVWSYEQPEAVGSRPYGTLTLGTGIQMPGDDAVWLRARAGTGATSHKPVYLRKYFHPAIGTSGAPDTVLAAQRTALATFGALLVGGTLPGSFKWSTPQGTEGTTIQTSVYITTRTLKKRGKRNPT